MTQDYKDIKPFFGESDEFWKFVGDHAGDDIQQLRLEWHNRGASVRFNIEEAILQIECRQRFGRKLASTLARFPRFYFPSTLSGEQATSDRLAAYHARFVTDNDTLVDLTAGLGVDTAHLARICRSATAIERSAHTAEALRYNLEGLGLKHVNVLTGDCRDALDDIEGSVAFIDPARRAADGGRVFGLADCEPNVVNMIPELAESFRRLVIKASPMLDISKMIDDIPGITDIYAIGTPTECRELVAYVVFHNPAPKPVRIHSVTLIGENRTDEFSFTREEELSAEVVLADRLPTAGDTLYEPYPSTMKAAPYRLLSSRFGLQKFNPNTHLYFSDRRCPTTSPESDFPGEKFGIVEVIPWQSKHIKRLAARYPHISLSVRNFGMSAADLRRKLGVSDGGDLRLFAVSIRQAPGRRQTAGGSSVGDRLLIVARPMMLSQNQGLV